MKKEKRLIGDYGSGNAFTIHKSKDNSGNDMFTIGATDDSTTGLAFLIIPFILIYLLVELVLFFVDLKKDRKNNDEFLKMYREKYYEKNKKYSKKCK